MGNHSTRYNARMNVVLLGFRGCGKTTIGQILAERLGERFVDVDEEVCRLILVGSIKEFWDRHGESAFRELEAVIAVDLLNHDNLVISLGGGTVMSHLARHAVEQADHVVRIYLRCEPAELCRRIQADPARQGTRPSSIGEPEAALDQITASLIERGPVYEAVADHVLDVTELEPDDAAASIIENWL